MDKKKFSTFSYKLVQISPIMILVNSGAFLSISSWFCEFPELIFVMIPSIYSIKWLPPNNAKDYGYVQVANRVSERMLRKSGRHQYPQASKITITVG